MALLLHNKKGEPFIREEWHLEDITEACWWLTPEQAVKVMEEMFEGYSEAYGICYDTVRDTATNLEFYEPEEAV